MSCGGLDKMAMHEKEEKEGEDPIILFFSEVHLDRAYVMKKLRRVFMHYENFAEHVLFVFAGNFTSTPVARNSKGMMLFKSRSLSVFDRG